MMNTDDYPYYNFYTEAEFYARGDQDDDGLFTCDSCGRNVPRNQVKSAWTGVTSPMQGDFCARCRGVGELSCPKCSSNNLHLSSISGDFPTGVVADGSREYVWEEGWECQNCGLVFDLEK